MIDYIGMSNHHHWGNFFRGEQKKKKRFIIIHIAILLLQFNKMHAVTIYLSASWINSTQLKPTAAAAEESRGSQEMDGAHHWFFTSSLHAATIVPVQINSSNSQSLVH